MAFFAVKGIQTVSRCNYRYLVVKVLLSILISVESDSKYNSGLTQVRYNSVECICPLTHRHRLLDAMGLCILSRNYPSTEKFYIAKKLNHMFESLTAEYRYSKNTRDKNVLDLLLPPFPGQLAHQAIGDVSVAESILHNNATSSFAVVVSSPAAVRFYDSKNMQLKRVITPTSSDSDDVMKFENFIWTENGEFFVASHGTQLTLWPIGKQETPPQDLEEELSRVQSHQIRLGSKIISITTRENVTNETFASFLVSLDNSTIVECAYRSRDVVTEKNADENGAAGGPKESFRILRRLASPGCDPILSVAISGLNVYGLTSTRILSSNIGTSTTINNVVSEGDFENCHLEILLDNYLIAIGKRTSFKIYDPKAGFPHPSRIKLTEPNLTFSICFRNYENLKRKKCAKFQYLTTNRKLSVIIRKV